ncbi:hypothetical protein K7432_013067 [Basidiobolus ranarum]|uniref:Uncharacterized protein n=1 Tax=Basidiobolus ranarum TaxID=34480 RepID=A0ABR2WJW2_9FUNG
MSLKFVASIFLIALINMSYGQSNSDPIAEEPEFVTQMSTQYVTLSQLRPAPQPTGPAYPN